MSESEISLEERLTNKLSKENISRQVLATLLRGDSCEQLAGALFITSTLLNEAIDLLKQTTERVDAESEISRKYQYFIEFTEHHRRRGKKVLDSAKAGHEAVYGTVEDKKEGS